MEVKSSYVEYDTDDGKVRAYLAEPDSSGSFPGVVLIHEIFGLDPHIEDVSRRLAAEGYVVLAPHLFSSPKFSNVLNQEGIEKTMKFIMSIPVARQRDENYRNEELSKLSEEDRKSILGVYTTLFINRPADAFTTYLERAVDFLKDRDNVSGKIGSVGFCFGGGMSINVGCTGKVDSVAIFYGENPEPIEKVEGVKNAVLGIYGGEDQRITSNVFKLVKALADYKKNFTIKVYKGAYHAFFNDSRKQTYNEGAAKDAWKNLLEFFSYNLKS